MKRPSCNIGMSVGCWDSRGGRPGTWQTRPSHGGAEVWFVVENDKATDSYHAILMARFARMSDARAFVKMMSRGKR